MEENEKDGAYIIHKVQAGFKYFVNRSEYNGKVFYKIPVEQKLQDGQKIKAYIQVRFKDDVDLPDGSRIQIKKAIENFYFRKEDTRKYNPIFYYQILEFDNIGEVVQEYNDATFDEPPF